MVPTMFRVNWPFGSGEEAKIYFHDGHHGGHLGFSIGMILAIFHLQVTPMLPTKFQDNWPFGSGEEAKNRISRVIDNTIKAPMEWTIVTPIRRQWRGLHILIH